MPALIAALVAAALIGSPAGAAARSKFEPLVRSWQAPPPRCPVTVYFASIGMGTDHAARGRIEALLERDPTVVSVRPYLRGRRRRPFRAGRVFATLVPSSALPGARAAERRPCSRPVSKDGSFVLLR